MARLTRAITRLSLFSALCGAILLSLPAHATPGYAKKEMKPCLFCHVTAKGGGENNARGLYYAKNSYSLAGFVEPPVVTYPKRGIVSDLRDRSGSGWEVTPKKVGITFPIARRLRRACRR